MIEELSIVALTVDLPDYNLRTGDTGTIVDVPPQGETYVVEFLTLLGKTVAVIEVAQDQIRPVDEQEIASARILG